MGLTGDFAELREMASKLRSLSSKGVVDMATASAAEVENQYGLDFKAQRDPWGDAWPGLKAGGGPALLGPTKNMGGTTATSSGKTIRMRPPAYWVFHQIGANNMHKRAVLPFGNIEATAWGPPIVARARRAFERHFR